MGCGLRWTTRLRWTTLTISGRWEDHVVLATVDATFLYRSRCYVFERIMFSSIMPSPESESNLTCFISDYGQTRSFVDIY
jgi:hypothetical protein